MTDKDYNEMYNEYIKGGKFADYVNKSAKTYDISVTDVLNKAITWEYYKSMTVGCNK